MGEKPGFFPNGPILQLQEKAGFPSSNHFFVLYTGKKYNLSFRSKAENSEEFSDFEPESTAFLGSGQKISTCAVSPDSASKLPCFESQQGISSEKFAHSRLLILNRTGRKILVL